MRRLKDRLWWLAAPLLLFGLLGGFYLLMEFTDPVGSDSAEHDTGASVTTTTSPSLGEALAAINHSERILHKTVTRESQTITEKLTAWYVEWAPRIEGQSHSYSDSLFNYFDPNASDDSRLVSEECFPARIDDLSHAASSIQESLFCDDPEEAVELLCTFDRDGYVAFSEFEAASLADAIFDTDFFLNRIAAEVYDTLLSTDYRDTPADIDLVTSWFDLATDIHQRLRTIESVIQFQKDEVAMAIEGQYQP